MLTNVVYKTARAEKTIDLDLALDLDLDLDPCYDQLPPVAGGEATAAKPLRRSRLRGSGRGGSPSRDSLCILIVN